MSEHHILEHQCPEKTEVQPDQRGNVSTTKLSKKRLAYRGETMQHVSKLFATLR
jgi:hypothetical protein